MDTFCLEDSAPEKLRGYEKARQQCSGLARHNKPFVPHIHTRTHAILRGQEPCAMPFTCRRYGLSPHGLQHSSTSAGLVATYHWPALLLQDPSPPAETSIAAAAGLVAACYDVHCLWGLSPPSVTSSAATAVLFAACYDVQHCQCYRPRSNTAAAGFVAACYNVQCYHSLLRDYM
jgi:hypothetical protein